MAKIVSKGIIGLGMSRVAIVVDAIMRSMRSEIRERNPSQ